jgi:chloramphenicol 3-O phosphotransferase
MVHPRKRQRRRPHVHKLNLLLALKPRRSDPSPGLQCRASGTGIGGENRYRRSQARLYRGAVATQVIVLNGGSSSGKSGIARCLQAVLPDPWLAFGVDSLIQAMPASSPTSVTGIEFAPDGAVIVGPQFRSLEAAWMEGVAAMARAGARIILDEVFLGGATSQRRWKKALGTLPVLWVGVQCDSATATGREIARGDRVIGMAASQAEVVHQGVVYDLRVDTTHTEALACARAIAARVR